MQAARGTSLSSDASTSPDQSVPGTRRWALFALVAVAAYAVDLGTKLLAVHRLADRQPVQVLGDWLQLTLVRNPGAAFSTGTSYTLVISLVAIVASVVVLWVSRRVRDPLWAVALGLLLGGIAGNLTDRLFRAPGPLRGHVVDFFQIPHWPVFNVADVLIDVAAGLILLQSLRGIRMDGRRHVRQDEHAGETTA